MAPTGKGVLRIAIEDFFKTSRIGQWLFGYYDDLVEGIEEGILTEFEPILREIEKVPELKPYFDVAKIRQGIGHHQGAAGALMGIGVSAGSGAAASLLAPLFKLLNYQIDKQVHSMRFDPGMAYHLQWRYPALKAEMDNHLNCLGYNPEFNDKMEGVIRPLLMEGELQALVLRGELSPEDYKSELVKRGYKPDAVDAKIKLFQIIPGISDLISMAVREAWNEEIVRRFKYDEELPIEAAKEAAKQGYSADWFKRAWRSHWQLPSPMQGFEMLHRLRPGTTENPFTVEDLKALLKTADYPEFFRDRLIEISFNPYTRVDVRRMYKLGILKEDQVKQSYLDIGYDDVHAENMTRFTVDYEGLGDESKIEKARSLNVGTITSAYKKNILDRNQASDYLAQLYYDPDEIEVIIKAAEFSNTVDKKPDYLNSFIADYKNLIDKAYASRLISKEETLAALKSIQFTDQEAELLCSNADFEYEKSIQALTLKFIGEGYINHSMDYTDVIGALGKLNISGERQNLLIAEWDIEKTYRVRQLSEAQYRALAKKSLISVEAYTDTLIGMGYTDINAQLLTDLYFNQGVEEIPG